MFANTDMDALRIVRPEIDRVIALAGSALAEPGNGELMTQSERELHRLRGAFEMAASPGLARFSECLGAGFAAAMREPAARERWHALLARSLGAMKNCLNEADRAGSVQSMMLFPVYVELKRAMGEDKVSASDLFYPAVDVERPRDERQPVRAEDSRAVARISRSSYHRALLAWLRGDSEAVATMLNAVATIDEQFGADSNFWWVACGFLEGIEAGGFPVDSHLKRICSRIDLQIARICEGASLISDALLREMLYFIGHSAIETPRIVELRSRFALAGYAEGERVEADDPAARAAAQRAVRTAQHALEGLAGGGEAGTAAFDAAIAAMSACLGRLRDPAVRAGAEAAAAEAHALGTGAAADAVPLAGLLLTLESALDDDASTGEARRVLQALLIGDADSAPADRLDPALAQEIQKSLKLAEHAVEGLARDDAPRDTAPALGALRRAAAALSIAGHDEAAKLVTHAENLARALCEAAEIATLLDPLADCLGAVELYVEAASRGNDGREVILPLLQKLGLAPPAEASAPPQRTAPTTVEEALERECRDVKDLLHNWQRSSARVVDELKSNLQAIHQDALLVADRETRERSAHALSILKLVPPAIDPKLEEAVAAVGAGAIERAEPPAAVDMASDQEVLEVFLEEARELIEAIRDHLATDATALDGLREIRRAFHTLKGSSRVVGLVHMGEVAWTMERQLNAWLDAAQPATPALLAAIGETAAAFSGWVSALVSGGSATVSAEDLVARIERLQPAGSGAQSEPAIAPAAQVVRPVPVPAPTAPELIQLGAGFTVARPLFEIFSAEARQHLDALRAAADGVLPGDTVRRATLRAAHTLAGISRTVRIAAVAGLAAALEAWLETMLDAGAALSEASGALLRETVARLGEMLRAIDGKAMPAADEALCERLAAATAAVVTAQDESPAAQQAMPSALPLEAVRMQGVNAEILPVVLDEAHELGTAIARELIAWGDAPGEMRHGEAVARHLHTLKGSVRAAGALELGEFAHTNESRIQSMLLNETADPAWIAELRQWFDNWLIAVDTLKSARAVAAAPAPGGRLEGEQQPPRAATQFRVAGAVVERLIEGSSELGLSRARTATEVEGIGQSVADLVESIARLRQQIREVEIQAESQMSARRSQLEEAHAVFDPLEFDRFTRLQELTRQMAESLHDVMTVQQNLRRHLDGVDEVLERERLLNRDMLDELMRIYAVPFGAVRERLERVVRQAAADLGKQVELGLRGGEVALDNGILDRILAPLEHLLRNAVAHGIETPAERRRAGKPVAGRLDVLVRQEANRVTIEIADDGRGLDLARIRQKAEQAGLIEPGAAIAEQELRALIFAPGLSTAEEVTEISGRGIGMDAVRNAVHMLGGTIEIRSEPGVGTRFMVHLPLTVVVVSIVTVSVDGRQLAIPASLVRQAQRVSGAALREHYEAGYITWQGERYPFHHLSELLGRERSAPTINERGNMILMLAGDERRVALHVDTLSVTQDVTLKDMGPQLGRVPALAGASVTGAGRVLLVIDPLQMLGRLAHTRREVQKTEDASPHQPLVLIVDDSITVRKVTSRLMERAGYRVATAKDGVEGLERIQDELPDIVLLDIEMPRMDGFEFTTHVRADPATRALPIIIISSRTADKHREHAARLGVNLFLGKPFEDDQLLGAVASLLAAGTPGEVVRTGT